MSDKRNSTKLSPKKDSTNPKHAKWMVAVATFFALLGIVTAGIVINTNQGSSSSKLSAASILVHNSANTTESSATPIASPTVSAVPSNAATPSGAVPTVTGGSAAATSGSTNKSTPSVRGTQNNGNPGTSTGSVSSSSSSSGGSYTYTYTPAPVILAAPVVVPVAPVAPAAPAPATSCPTTQAQDPTTWAACRAGYVAPRIVWGGLVSCTTVNAAAGIWDVKWKWVAVGGNYRGGFVGLADNAAGIDETQIQGISQADLGYSFPLNASPALMFMSSMNGLPGPWIDKVTGPSGPSVVLSTVCH